MYKGIENGNRYVTYKWLLVTMIGIIVTTLTFSLTIANLGEAKLDKKLDKEAYYKSNETLYREILEIKVIIKENQDKLSLIDKRQAKVLQKLNIPE